MRQSNKCDCLSSKCYCYFGDQLYRLFSIPFQLFHLLNFFLKKGLAACVWLKKNTLNLGSTNFSAEALIQLTDLNGKKG